MAYDEIIEKTFAENWPEPLGAMALSHEVLPLVDRDLRAWAGAFPRLRADFGLTAGEEFSDGLKRDVEFHLKAANGRLFVKSSYGMLKQNPFAYAPVTRLRELDSNLRWPDTRIEGYLRNRLSGGSLARLVLLPWVAMEPWQEWRVFIEDGRLLGVSQYHSSQVFPELRQHVQAIGQAVSTFCETLLPALHLPSVVADVHVSPAGRDRLHTKLAELNPFLPMTDPCLYSWSDLSRLDGGRFDGGLRYRT